jgi:hypothetical protein
MPAIPLSEDWEDRANRSLAGSEDRAGRWTEGWEVPAIRWWEDREGSAVPEGRWPAA